MEASTHDSNMSAGQYPNDCSMHWTATPVASRAKLAFVALVPALWLVACGQSLLIACDDPTGCSHSQCGLDADKDCHSMPLSCSDDAVRVTRSRVVNFFGKSSLTFWGDGSTSSSARPPVVARLASNLKSPELATFWQFACRAALEPRAPCLVS